MCADQHGTELHIYELAVRLDRQRLGLGRNLVAVTIRAAQRRRVDSITLTTFSGVAWNAPFYEHLGFRRLHARNMGARLRAILRGEVQAGLPAGVDVRCA
ncbi:GNAT family N-acetyltransferase [Sphingomonas oligophenolica]|uniref:GNAT family N-acetyltransferase n=1 Tax=Sphingomonas oligophenolica TaxID=301154 RepID=UPI003D00120A